MIVKEKKHCLLRDTSGASIVIALVFFLICAIVGSAVVTAASVQAKAAQTHSDLQQSEYTMQSAAELVAKQLGGEVATKDPNALTKTQSSVVISAIYDTGAKKYTADVSKVVSPLGSVFWTEQRASDLLSGTVLSSVPITIKAPSGSKSTTPVYGNISVDGDLNVTVRLSLSESFDEASPYNMTVHIQCTPTYNAAGKITEFTYGDNTVIEKTS